ETGGSWAQVKLLESGGKVTHEGQSVTLTCKASGFNFKDYAMSWHWNPSGSNRQFVASISPKTGSKREYKPSIQGRALITRNNEANTVSLTLRQLRKEDSGIYYCAKPSGLRQWGPKWEPLAEQWENFGPGTELTVLPLEKTLLTESGGGTYQAGKTLSLKCQTSGFQFKTSQLDWYLWTPGHAPLWLTGLNSSSTDATEGRITSSREDNKNQIFLQIEDLGLRDSGQYHCARRVGNGDDTDKLVFGLGTRVIVEPRPAAPLSPSVFLVRDQDAVACLIRNFYPKELHVSLTSSGTLISAQSLSLAPTASGTYSAIHIGRVGENDAITCSVKHLGKEIHMSHQAGSLVPR
uniref:T cell receptor mu chain n=2 Tax=Monodelphis domestica TaxID=13616 RepID=UPI001AA00CD0|nr:Chain A, T cell receptor mu chain [Monodelphis domestica]7K0Z_C Chain C, T cell receptor mu chain [Monodelphis domestica]